MSYLSEVLAFHASLLSDTARLERFRRALQRVVRPGDVVLDVGAGVGILSVLACEAGASRVYAIEGSVPVGIIEMLAEANGMADRVHAIGGNSTAIELPEQVDVVVADLFELFGLEQGLVAAMADAARRFLREGGTVIPRAISLYAAPVEAPGVHGARVGAWSREPLGMDVSPVRPLAANVLHAASHRSADELAAGERLARVPLGADGPRHVGGAASFAIRRPGVLYGFDGWFVAELARGVTVSNAPGSRTTRYRHAFLPIDPPQLVAPGDEVELEVHAWDGEQWRWSGRAGERTFDHATLHALPIAALRR
ncbi:MAG: 50S ribosomal protein L11 methyltransferase [Solirubrobacterales bacterium]|nr:50S ribosomal protein L11 methyltransferase [Solirubrobacterales bacterium]